MFPFSQKAIDSLRTPRYFHLRCGLRLLARRLVAPSSSEENALIVT